MSQNVNLQTPPKIKITESAIYGQWEVTHYSNCNEQLEPILYTQRTKYHFLEEMVFIRINDGVSSQGMWRLSETNNGKFGYSITLNNQSELGIVHLDSEELILSDGCIEYNMIRRI